MSDPTAHPDEFDPIAAVIQHYIDGARSGRGDEMKPAFHQAATVFGYLGEDLLAGPVRQLFDWNDDQGPATELDARIVSVDVAHTVATVRVELDHWIGHRFTDLFTLLKVDGDWKIMNKVFHLHTDGGRP
jgi:hypothetical protein